MLLLMTLTIAKLRQIKNCRHGPSDVARVPCALGQEIFLRPPPPPPPPPKKKNI